MKNRFISMSEFLYEEETKEILKSIDPNNILKCLYRPNSYMFERYYNYIKENKPNYKLDNFEIEVLNTDIGNSAIVYDTKVLLDYPLLEEKELNSPKRGGTKKFYVYTKNDKGNIIKVQFGDTSGLKVKIDNEKARKNFASRHNCKDKTDKTTAGYWSCRLPRYAKQLGLDYSGSKDAFW